MLKDNKGREFDPEIHVALNGEPVINKNGTLKCKTFIKSVAPTGEISTALPQDLPERKRKKGHLGANRRLEDLFPRLGFVRRWVSDVEGRIQRLIDSDYNVVEDKRQTTSRGAGGGIVQRLMEIPVQYRKEDMAEKAKGVTSLEGDSNKLGSGEYSPAGKDTALRADKNPLR